MELNIEKDKGKKVWDIFAGYGYEDWGSNQYSPYFDIGAYPQNQRLLYDYMNNTGVDYAFLAYVVTDVKSKSLVWGGTDTPVSSLKLNGRELLYDDIRRLREEGKDIGISFGGAEASELPETSNNVSDSIKEYKSFIEAYGFTHVDFDIEGKLAYQTSANLSRAYVLKELSSKLRDVGHPLIISYTLSLGTNGIEPKDLAIIEPCIAARVNISRINFKAFDYGEVSGNLEQTTERALKNTHEIIKKTFAKYGNYKTDQEIWQLIGITSMAYLDNQNHLYTLSDVQKSLDFAYSLGIRYLSMWNINRDSKDNDYLHPGVKEGVYSRLFSKFQTNDGSTSPFKTAPPYFLPRYDVNCSYRAGARVQYNSKDYLCVGWARPGDIPEVVGWAWRIL